MQHVAVKWITHFHICPGWRGFRPRSDWPTTGESRVTDLSFARTPFLDGKTRGRRGSLRRVSLTISVIGTGYLGIVHAACMAELGHTVIAVDTNVAKVESLCRGVAPLFELGLDELLATVLATGRLRFTTDYAQVLQR